jgi:acyl-coenzyme A thioesterase PaaI-like protein
MSDVRPIVRGPEALFGAHLEQPDPSEPRLIGSMPTGPRLRGPDGRPSVGSLGVLADDVLGYALIASLPTGRWTVSTELWLDILAPLPAEPALLHGASCALQPGSFAGARFNDVDGRLVAVGRERGRAVAQDVGALVRDAPEGPLGTGAADVLELIGLRPRDDDVLSLAVTPALENPRRMLHGGISFCASEVAATWSRVQAGSDLATSSVHIVHARPVPSGSVVEFDCTTRHAGRSLWVTDVVGSVDRRAVTFARVSAE